MYEFGPYRLDPREKLLLHRGSVVALTPKAVEVLLVLVARAGQVVTHEELFQSVWPNTFVGEGNLTQTIFLLRKALANGSHAQFIETMPRRGYRFSAPVRQLNIEATAGRNSGSMDLPSGSGVPDAVSGSEEPTLKPVLTAQIAPRSLPVHRPLRVGGVVVVFAVIAAAAIIGNQLRPPQTMPMAQVMDLRKEAERNYLRGRSFWQKRTESAYRTAIANFQQAVALDPNYAEAYAGLADSYILLGSFGVQRLGEVIPQARAAALRAIELNERSAEAHASIAYIMSRFDWNWEQADREFRRALELDPQYTTAHEWYALHLVTLGRTEEAIAQMRTAEALDPKSPVLKSDTALVLFYARHYFAAEQECQRALQADASFGLAHRTLGAIYAAEGSYLQAISEFETATRLMGRDPWMIAEIGRSYARLGQRQKALARMRELHQLAGTQFVAPSAFALLSASLPDRRDQSLRWLQEDFDQHANIAILSVHPGFDSLRQDPRFQDLLRKTGLPQRTSQVSPLP